MPRSTFTKLGLITAAVLILGAGCYAKKTATTNTTTTTTNTSTNTTVAGNTVSIQGFAFTPSNITVKKGTTVTWDNNDSTNHTVTGTSGGPASGTLSPGGNYSFTFDTVGTFNYHCNIHSSMTGSVTVTQ